MPFTIVSVRFTKTLRMLQVVESSEIPPLPVSSIKLSGTSCGTSLASITITPPVKVLKGIVCSNFAIGCVVFTCALPASEMRNISIVANVLMKRVLRFTS